mmetsp:Transcript_25527/g.24825  ORF Transcript_25527/g.24825 Transcript_25527/m.24825 type:complete len:88 (-) Transcript_25527:807-1070(-)
MQTVLIKRHLEKPENPITRIVQLFKEEFFNQNLFYLEKQQEQRINSSPDFHAQENHLSAPYMKTDNDGCNEQVRKNQCEIHLKEVVA